MLEPQMRQALVVTIVRLSLSGLLAVPSTASGQAGWTEGATDLSGVGIHSAPDLAVDAAGNVFVAYCALGAPNVVRAVRYDVSQETWTLSAVFPSDVSCRARVVVSREGDAVLLWSAIDAPGGPVAAAYYTAATARWSEVGTLGEGFGAAIEANAAGDAAVAWLTPVGPTRFEVLVSTFSATTRIWSRIGAFASESTSAHVAIDAFGTVTLVWSPGMDGMGLRATRYSASAGTWGPVVDIVPGAERASGPHLVADAQGNAAVVWRHGTGALVRVARFSRATDHWSVPVELATYGSDSPPRLAANSTGTLVVIWTEDGWDWGVTDVYSSEYTAQTDAWRTPELVRPVSGPIFFTEYAFEPDVAIDDSGNRMAVWGTDIGVRAARSVTDDPWSSGYIDAYWETVARHSAVRLDPSGNATAIWQKDVDWRSNTSVIRARRWAATPGAPRVAAVVSGDTTLELDIVAPGSSEPQLATTNYEVSTDDGRTWTPRVPASASSPIVVTGLINGAVHSLRVRAVNRAGAGRQSDAKIGMAGLTPPSRLTTLRVAADAVTLAWLPPVTGVRPSHYVIEGGVSPGQVAATIPSPTAATMFTFRAPVGAFYLRVRAVFGDTMSAPSNELPLLVGVPTPPSAPKGLLGLADGSTVRLAWENTFNSGTPSGIVLEISGTHTVSIPLALTDRFEFPSVPNGTYRVAVRAMNTFGSSAPSNAVTLTFPGGCTPPHMPSHFLAFRSGRTIGMSWGLPNDGTAPDRYLVSVSGSGSGSFETAGLMLQADVPSGTYALSVAAMNACGTSANTPTQIVVVP